MKRLIKKQFLIPCIGLLVFMAVAVFCYTRVENTIIGNEQEGLKSLAKVNAQSMRSSLEAKENMIFALFSDDMENQEACDAAFLKLGEKGSYASRREIEICSPADSSISITRSVSSVQVAGQAPCPFRLQMVAI